MTPAKHARELSELRLARGIHWKDMLGLAYFGETRERQVCGRCLQESANRITKGEFRDVQCHPARGDEARIPQITIESNQRR